MPDILKSLTGWLNPIFYVHRKSDNALIKQWELEFINGGEGLLVEYEEYYNEKEFLDYSLSEEDPDIVIEQDFLGIRYWWTFNWVDQLPLATGLAIKEIFDYRNWNEGSGRTEIYYKLKPRKDRSDIYVIVKDPETLRIVKGKGYELSEGDEGFSMKWKSKGLIKNLDWANPNNIEYAGDVQSVSVGQLQ